MGVNKILHVVGARPNFIKLAPVVEAIYKLTDYKQTIVHTGQHYDADMSQTFFDELKIPKPDYNLKVGSDSHTVQTAKIMLNLEGIIITEKPNLVIVYGDVNSTLAAAIVCSKMSIPIAHVEAGLRSFDRTMPEEINRIVTDRLSSLLFTHSLDADNNLVREGVFKGRKHFVGNVMIDTLVKYEDKINSRCISHIVPKSKYGLVTLHRPSNVDNKEYLSILMNTLKEIGKDIPLIFPAHPRTVKSLVNIGFESTHSDVSIIKPVSYLQCLFLQKYSSFVITDSGGIQEETTYMGVPCITVRDNTERMVTVTEGTNILLSREPSEILAAVKTILSTKGICSRVPELWDGYASERIVDILKQFLH